MTKYSKLLAGIVVITTVNLSCRETADEFDEQDVKRFCENFSNDPLCKKWMLRDLDYKEVAKCSMEPDSFEPVVFYLSDLPRILQENNNKILNCLGSGAKKTFFEAYGGDIEGRAIIVSRQPPEEAMKDWICSLPCDIDHTQNSHFNNYGRYLNYTYRGRTTYSCYLKRFAAHSRDSELCVS